MLRSEALVAIPRHVAVAAAPAANGGDADASAIDARFLGPWLRLLWNIAPDLHHLPSRPALEDGGGEPAPWLSRAGLHLPAPPKALAPDAAHCWMRAAGAHAAAHLVFSRSVFIRQGVAPVTCALTGLLEDARSEALAARELPGLARLWRTQHVVTPQSGEDFEALMARLARALADPDYADPHPWVRKGRALFWRDAAQQVLAEPRADAMRALASQLGHDIGQMRLGFNLRRYRPQPDYRDDNRWLWHEDQVQHGASTPAPVPAQAQARDDAAPETPPRTAGLLQRYPEWDQRAAVLRRAWCTVHEFPMDPPTGLPEGASPPGAPQPMVRALESAARRARSWQPSATGGDEIDLREAVRIVLLRRAGLPDVDGRPYQRVRTLPQRTAALLLVDASASSADVGDASGETALARQCAQSGLLARAMHRAGWRVAVQAFRSAGRHFVEVNRVLDFGEPWNEAAAARLRSLRPGLSTRLGAVVRHATRALLAQPADARWALMLGDGVAHDIDVHDARHLVADTHAAVAVARRAGVCVGCLCPGAGEGGRAAVEVFGPTGTVVVGSSAPVDLSRALARLMR